MIALQFFESIIIGYLTVPQFFVPIRHSMAKCLLYQKLKCRRLSLYVISSIVCAPRTVVCYVYTLYKCFIIKQEKSCLCIEIFCSLCERCTDEAHKAETLL